MGQTQNDHGLITVCLCRVAVLKIQQGPEFQHPGMLSCVPGSGWLPLRGSHFRGRTWQRDEGPGASALEDLEVEYGTSAIGLNLVTWSSSTTKRSGKGSLCMSVRECMRVCVCACACVCVCNLCAHKSSCV